MSRPPVAVAIDAPRWTDAVLSADLDDGRVRCELCPHRCVLADGETGVCRVRRNSGHRLQTATFAATVTHLDAIERKPLYHFRPGSQVLTLAAPGCTLRCNYCLNHELSQYGRVEGIPWTGQAVDPAALLERAGRHRAAIGFSYTEAALAVELTVALSGRDDVPLVWKTNGFLTPRAVDLVAPLLSAVNVDVKAADEAAHQRLTGAALAPVLDAVERFRSHGVWVEVATPLIPDVNDDPRQWRRTADRLAAIDPDLPWHLLRFTPDFRMGRYPPTPPAALERAAEVGKEAGLRYVYVERALGDEGRRTRCPQCDTAVVDRGIWQTMTVALVDGACPRCHRTVAGRWD